MAEDESVCPICAVEIFRRHAPMTLDLFGVGPAHNNISALSEILAGVCTECHLFSHLWQQI